MKNKAKAENFELGLSTCDNLSQMIKVDNSLNTCVTLDTIRNKHVIGYGFLLDTVTASTDLSSVGFTASEINEWISN